MVSNFDQIIVCLWFLPVTLFIILPLGIGLVWMSIVAVGTVLSGLIGYFGSFGYRELSKPR